MTDERNNRPQLCNRVLGNGRVTGNGGLPLIFSSPDHLLKNADLRETNFDHRSTQTTYIMGCTGITQKVECAARLEELLPAMFHLRSRVIAEKSDCGFRPTNLQQRFLEIEGRRLRWSSFYCPL